MKKLTMLFAASLLTLAACKKDDVPASTVDNARISKLEYDDNFAELSYNADGSINKITAKETDGTLTAAFNFVYDAGKIKEVDMGIAKFKYTYTGTNVTKVEAVALNNMVIRTYEYTYLNDRLSGQTEYDAMLEPQMKIALTYTGGNVSKMEMFSYVNDSWEKSSEVLITEFDNKKNYHTVLENTPYIPVKNVVTNNALREIHKDAAGTTTMTVVHAYTYDSNNKPLTRRTTESVPGMADEVSVTKFYY